MAWGGNEAQPNIRAAAPNSSQQMLGPNRMPSGTVGGDRTCRNIKTRRLQPKRWPARARARVRETGSDAHG